MQGKKEDQGVKEKGWSGKERLDRVKGGEVSNKRQVSQSGLSMGAWHWLP